MSWLLFYLLAALHPVAFLFIAWRCKTWKQRLLLWCLLPLPAIWYCWDYYVIKNEHTQMCAADGGLRVLIQPEKVDRVRIIGDIVVLSPKYILEEHYPHVKVVEALTANRDPMTGRPLAYYEAYTIKPDPTYTEPKPKAGQWKRNFPQEGKFLFPSTRLDVLDPNMYEVSERETKIPHGTKTELILSKGGKVYARHTELVHWWTGIQYPDALPTWRCPVREKHPPVDDPNAPFDKWIYPPSAHAELKNLIFK